MAIAPRNKKSYRARPGMEIWPEMARRNKNDPAKTHEAACLRPKTRNSQIAEAMDGPTRRESMRSIKSGKRLETELFMRRDLQRSLRFFRSLAIFHLSGTDTE